MKESPEFTLRPLTVIVDPETASDEPVGAVVVAKPGSVPVVEGRDHPDGTVRLTSPSVTVPAAVYVKVSVWPADPAVTELGAAVIVPDPSATTRTDGDTPRGVSVSGPPPEDVEFSAAVKVDV